MPSLVQKLTAECFGTFVLALTVLESIQQKDVPVPVVAGLTLLTLAYALGPISGTHVNPGVSMSVFGVQAFTGENPNWLVDCCGYIFSQFVGACTAGLITAKFANKKQNLAEATLTQMDLSHIVQACLFEFMASFIFFTVILRTAVSKSTGAGQMAGVAIGLSLTVCLYACCDHSGGGMNPAVGSGVVLASIISGGSSNGALYCYFIGPILASFFAVAFFFVLEPSAAPESAPAQDTPVEKEEEDPAQDPAQNA